MWRHGDMDMETSNKKWKTEAQAIFLNPFTICISCKLKIVDKETNGSYPFANGLNGLNRLAHI
jgi:hypothetical protein